MLLSAHAFDAMPAGRALLDLVERGRSLGADVVKLAVHAADVGHLRTLLEVTLAATVPVVTLAMGPMGPLSRVVLPAAGSLLTYGHGRAPAGPLPAAELRRSCFGCGGLQAKSGSPASARD